MSADKPFNILFLCTGNSARSIMAEAIMNQLSVNRGRFRAYSAGSHPRGEVHPFVLDLLRASGHDVSNLQSKSWDAFATLDAPKMDFVFTVCDSAAAEVCPVWPGSPLTAHWGVPDPTTAEGSEAERRFAFADTYRMLSNRIGIFVNLPIQAGDVQALKRSLDDIGRPLSIAS